MFPSQISPEQQAEIIMNVSGSGWHSGSVCHLKSMAYTRHTPFRSVKRRCWGQNQRWAPDGGL